MIAPRILDGTPPEAGPETFRQHAARLGPLPRGTSGLIREIDESGLRGRGGAAFPVAAKWRAVAERAAGDARVLVNGAEGEPLSAKDRTVMAFRPHLVLDGAEIAAETVGADEIVLYVGAIHARALGAMQRAVAERRRVGRRSRVRIVPAPYAYVAGEESAAVHYINEGDARPTNIPPRPFERGIDGRPTLVQNVETLAMTALIARRGAEWYRSVGRADAHGSGLVTISRGDRLFVREIELGTRIGELAASSGGAAQATGAVLLGGYFGQWQRAEDAWAMPLDPVRLREAGYSFGAGVVSFIGRDECGVMATAGILDYMAGQSAAQCGPCVFGLRAIADAIESVARMTASPAEVARLERWSEQLVGRGACRHPDGAAGLVLSALDTFSDDIDRHVRFRRCTTTEARIAA